MRRAVVGVMALAGVVAAAALLYPHYVHPRVETLGPGEHVDAVVALGGEPRTAQQAVDLARSGVSDTVVLSDPYDGDSRILRTLCPDPPPDLRVVCFAPDPSTTRGEAREIRDLAEQNGWTRVAVMTPTYHVGRARFIVERCWSGEVVMLDAGLRTPPWQWAYQFVYQTAGWGRALSQRGC